MTYEWKYENPIAKYGVSSSVKLMMRHRSVVRGGSYFSQSVLIFSRELELHFSGHKRLLTPQRAWRKKTATVILWNMISYASSWNATTYRMLDFQPVGGKTTNSSSRNGSFALQTRAAHYLLESEHTPTNGCGDVYNSSNKTRRKTDPQSTPLSPLSINDCSGRGRERVMDAGLWRLSPSPLWWNGKSQRLPADWAAGD